MDILITIPQRLAREDVLDQLNGCNGPVGWHFMCNRLPKQQPEHLWFVHHDELIGSLPVIAIEENSGPQTLRQADGNPLHVDKKYAIVGSGVFEVLDPMPPYRGFQGWRYFNGLCPECHGLAGLAMDDAGWDPCVFCGGLGDLRRPKAASIGGDRRIPFDCLAKEHVNGH